MEIEKTAGERADELPVRSSDTLVGDGAVDFRGKLADKITTGGWRAAPFIIVNEVAERMAFYAIAFNMVIFLVKEMHEDLPDASTNVTNWGGTAFVLTTIAFSFAAAHAVATNRRLSAHFVVPAGSVVVFSVVNGLIVIPLYELYGASFFRRFTGHPHGLSSLQRVGLGMFVTIPTFVVAALVERHRRRAAEAVTFWWLLPQYFMPGFADAFTFVGQLEFFYNEATDGTKSISSALFLSAVGVGNWMTSLSVKVLERATGGKERGWLRKDLNHSKLDYYYWIVCAICAVNFCVYLVVASYHKGKDQVVIHSTTGEDESSGTKRLIAAEEAL
ncbi:hypothetical protein HPP92_027270 [Vanilla planifolia]|uniref:Uncharacterized protein n=1 Tax=Vanilla planifolia TaxID=51239 RepID=A0A835P9H4_VANPL|nr:hypothetical protein HPP92_027270 [Vanilla planifolia]